MPSSVIIDTAIGLALLFFLLAVLTSAIVEWFANLFKKRAKTLLVGLREMLNPTTANPAGAGLDPLKRVTAIKDDYQAERALYKETLNPGASTAVTSSDAPVAVEGHEPPTLAEVMNHSLIEPFKQARGSGGKVRNPSYLPGRTIARVLVDLLVPNKAGQTTMTAVIDSINNMGNSSLKQSLLALATTTQGGLAEFVTAIEDWYDAQMQRVSGIYKRWAKKVSIAVAIIVVAALHVDAIEIAMHLWSDAPARAAVVAAAADLSGCASPTPESSPSPTTSPEDANKAARECVNAKVDVLKDAGIPIGPQLWNRPEPTNIAQLILGFAISIIAASMGAPFWFGALNRVTSLRNAGPKPTIETE